MVRVGVAAAIPAVLRSLAADPAEVLAEVGFEPEFFSDPDNLISYSARGRLLAHCVTRTGCKHFGLLVGQHGRLSSLGLVGFLVRNAPDVGTALESLVRYLHLHVRGAVPSLTLHGKSAALGYEIYLSHVEANDQTADGAVAVIFNILRELCGPDWRPLEVLLAHRRPVDVGPFRRFFRAPLRYDAEQNAVSFSVDWLHRRVPESDPELRRLLQKQVDALEARHRDDFPEQVRSVLRTALPTATAKADQVAAVFSMRSRTLNRRLNAFGTTFQRLVDEVRFEIARQTLEHSAMNVSRIAAMLGYTDASAFTRAFRRWSGTTPATWRANLGHRDSVRIQRRRAETLG